MSLHGMALHGMALHGMELHVLREQPVVEFKLGLF